MTTYEYIVHKRKMKARIHAEKEELKENDQLPRNEEVITVDIKNDHQHHTSPKDEENHPAFWNENEEEHHDRSLDYSQDRLRKVDLNNEIEIHK